MEQIPETDKKPGVCYAFTDDGIELPIIDITHPAFTFEISDVELNALIESMQRAANIPPSYLQSLAPKSILIRGMVESAGTFTTGMMTYLNKLGPDNLGEGYASALDRQWAASLTPVTFRWRMRDVVRLLANGFMAALAARPNDPAHLINIGGGPAADSLNALILIQKERPDLLAGRDLTIHVLDLDAAGPHFGARALKALLAEGAPLHGLHAHFNDVPYDWTNPSTLRGLLEPLTAAQCAVAGSTEGGLFEYAADADIIANLQTLHACTPPDFIIVGPVVRDPASSDPRLQGMDQVAGRPAIRFMGLTHFAQLAQTAGWRIQTHLDGPMHQVVSLEKES